MNVSILGPNLSKTKQRLGDLHVHKAACGHLRTYTRQEVKEASQMEADSLRDVVLAMYPPSNFLYDPADPQEYSEYRQSIYFAPCTNDLPEVA